MDSFEMCANPYSQALYESHNIVQFYGLQMYVFYNIV